jgi:hypothetical protein
VGLGGVGLGGVGLGVVGLGGRGVPVLNIDQEYEIKFFKY